MMARLHAICSVCQKPYSFWPSQKQSACSGTCAAILKWRNPHHRRRLTAAIRSHRPIGVHHGRWKGGIRTDDKGYVWVRMPHHPRAQAHGYIKRAWLVLEEKLGRSLLWPEEDAHHKDENKSNDEVDNLELRTHADHARHHALRRPKSLEMRTCTICGADVVRRPSAFQQPPERTTCSIRCRNRLNAGRHDALGRFTGDAPAQEVFK